MKASPRGHYEQTFPRKRIFTRILDIRVKRLIYSYKWWDGWAPNCQPKCLFAYLFSLAACADAPTNAPSHGWLSQDIVGQELQRRIAAQREARGTDEP
jgi:hypothetical protein